LNVSVAGWSSENENLVPTARPRSWRPGLDLGLGASCAPAQCLGHQRRGLTRGSKTAVGGGEGQAGATREYVLEPERALVRAGVDHFSAQVLPRAIERLGELGARLEQGHELLHSVAVTIDQGVDR
jgi:hypothetical protein